MADEIFYPADFEMAELDSLTSVGIDFKDLDYINSEMLRGMCIWLQKVEAKFPTLKIEFENLPSSAYSQFFNIRQMIPKAVSVYSLYIPYFCETCTIDIKQLIIVPNLKKALKPEDRLPPRPKCEKCSAPMEPDIDFETFFESIRK